MHVKDESPSYSAVSNDYISLNYNPQASLRYLETNNRNQDQSHNQTPAFPCLMLPMHIKTKAPRLL